MLFNVCTDTRIIKVIEKYLIGNILEKILVSKLGLMRANKAIFNQSIIRLRQ